MNLGPLLYHYSDVQFEGSIEPTYEDLISVIRAFGFEILVSAPDRIVMHVTCSLQNLRLSSGVRRRTKRT